MAIIHIISFVMIAFTAGYLLKQHLSDMLPFVWCIIVLTLYVLAFFRGLSTIDIVMPIAAIVLLGIVMLKGKTERMTYVKYVQESALSISFITYVLLAIFICICVSGKVVTWWDDVNFWASDLKSLYYLNGFAGKYANVSPEFGDYPPAVQLAKWYIVHLNRSDFCEGMAFIGYYLFGLSFLMPIYKNVGVKKAYISLPFAIVSWLFAGIADKYGYAGFCADLTMAFIFGAILIEALRYKKEDGVIPGIRVGLYLAVLTLCKSTGAIWALFGLVIWCGAFFANNGKMTARKAINGLWIAVFPFFAGTTWILFCLTKHRVTKTTATAITYITTDDYSISFYTADFAKAFAKAFFTQPLHVDHVGITVPPAAMLLTIIVVFYTFIKKEYIRGKGGRFIAWALPIMGVLYYAVIFVAHITIFATETQYLEAEGMIASIERYGVPFVIGALMLISAIWIEKRDNRDCLRYALFCAVVVLLTNIPAAYDSAIGYRKHIETDIQDREAFVDNESKLFVEMISKKLEGGNVRVCRMHDGGYYRVADTYVAYEASPVSVMNISFNLSSNDVDAGTLIWAINQTHATYLYVDEQAPRDTILDEMTADGSFNYRTLYYISYEDGGMKLYEK